MTIYKTRQEVADEYGFSRVTLFRKLKACGLKLPRTLLNNSHIQLIYKVLGPPQRNIISKSSSKHKK